MIEIDFLYDSPVPAPYAALIQILKTARALCDLHIRVNVYFGPMRITRYELLTNYGLTSHPLLDVQSFFRRRFARLGLRHRLERLLADTSDRERFVVLRGESGLDVLTAWPNVRATPILEMHRLCVSRAYEEIYGEPWSAGVTLPGRLRKYFDKEIKATRRAAGVMCITPGVEQALRTTLGYEGPTCLLPSGTDEPDAARSARGFEARDLDLVYTGKLSEAKGLDTVIDAMPRLPRRTLDVYGGSSQEIEKLAQRAAARNVADRVRFHGWTQPNRIAEMLFRTKVAVCPIRGDRSSVSDRFSSPLKVLQSMACGAVVVASDVEPVRNIADCGVIRRVPDPSVDAWAAALESALSNPEDAEVRRKRGLELVHDYTWRRRAERIQAFLTSISTTGGSARGA